MNSMRRILWYRMYSWLAATAAAALAIGISGLSVLPANAFAGCSAENVPAINAAYESRVAQLVNQERAANGLPPLKLIPTLSAAARYHANDMGADDYFQHDSFDRTGSGLQRVCGAFERVNLWYSGWTAAGENIAAGYDSPEAVMAAWMQSEGHRSNILSPDFVELGVGYFSGAGTFPSYWVQDFGRRSGVSPLIVAGEAASTAARDVELYVYGDWSEIRLRNDARSWSDWMPFSNRLGWTLEGGNGMHVVSAELRSGAATGSACDLIVLAEAASTGSTTAAVQDEAALYLPAVMAEPLPDCK